MNLVCTLAEGDYHVGVAALANSLYHSKFRGEIRVGFRGTIPEWNLPRTSLDNKTIYTAAEGLQVSFIQVDTSWHLSNYKPVFMDEMLSDEKSQVEALFYFDPDIVLTCSFKFLLEWARFGVCLCEEIVQRGMPADHPLRLMWLQWASENGFNQLRTSSQYFNSGFIGVTQATREVPELWCSVLRCLESCGCDMAAFGDGIREDPFLICDQDALNLATMLCTTPLSTVGPEGMAFVPGGFIMAHAAGAAKPWRKPFVRAALSGIGPSIADKMFIKFCNGPIPVYSKRELGKKVREIRVASALGRVLRRS